MARAPPRTAETTEVTLAIEAISEEVGDVAEDAVDGATTAVIEAGRQSVITEPPEMIEVLPLFVMIGAVIATDGIAMTALEVAEHRHLKAVLGHPIMDLGRPEMDHRT